MTRAIVVLEAVLQIFDVNKAATIAFEVRLGAAELSDTRETRA